MASLVCMIMTHVCCCGAQKASCNSFVCRQRRHRSGGKQQLLLLQLLLQLPHLSSPVRAPPRSSSLLVALTSLRTTQLPHHLPTLHLRDQGSHHSPKDLKQMVLWPLLRPRLHCRSTRHQFRQMLMHPQLWVLPSRQLPELVLGASQHKPRLRLSQQLLNSQRLLLLQNPMHHLLHCSSSSRLSRQSRQHISLKHSRWRQQLLSQVGRCQTCLGRKRQQLPPSRSRERLGASLVILPVSALLQASVSSPVHGASLRGKLNSPHRLSLKHSSNNTRKLHLHTQIKAYSRHSRLKSLPSLQVSLSRQQSRHPLRPPQRWTAKGRRQQAQAQRWQAKKRTSASNKEEHLQ